MGNHVEDGGMFDGVTGRDESVSCGCGVRLFFGRTGMEMPPMIRELVENKESKDAEALRRGRFLREEHERDDRVKVERGAYTVGDTVDIDGRRRTIRGFGKSWRERTDAGKEHFRGQIWEECSCGQEPVYMPSFLCEECIHKRFGAREREVRYAYLE